LKIPRENHPFARFVSRLSPLSDPGAPPTPLRPRVRRLRAFALRWFATPRTPRAAI
jgi:hypothetical protein